MADIFQGCLVPEPKNNFFERQTFFYVCLSENRIIDKPECFCQEERSYIKGTSHLLPAVFLSNDNDIMLSTMPFELSADVC